MGNEALLGYGEAIVHSMLYDEEAYFEHAGIKGMKWGIRKQRAVADIRRFGKKVKRGVRNYRVTPTQKKVAKGALIAGGILGALAGIPYALIASGMISSRISVTDRNLGTTRAIPGASPDSKTRILVDKGDN